ncbi:pseudouridine synthase [Intestinicryptomonas porci]|uniref:Pseudouridine synthase n=1 Tax=Intestinicryptomonas porci TaxID=2926320 RepID=A0ABU4WE62_9BACT|nr:rRNA pseudouridine synthase [Opitutales bacterium CLA-KB-P66]
MRIQKYLSQCGVCSRREAEKRILEGRVSLNGAPAEIGADVNPEKDRVVVDGKAVKGIVEEKVVLAMNKPVGYLCTNEDRFDGKTVFELLREPYSEMKLFCVGRLDKNSQGLLILTNDGELANFITHPSNGVVKRYRILLNRDFDKTLIPVLLDGVMHDGEKLRALRISTLANKDAPLYSRRLEVWLNQGRKREIRRMFEAVGYFVKELVRFQIGKYELRRISEGSYKKLQQKDIDKLKSNPQ